MLSVVLMGVGLRERWRFGCGLHFSLFHPLLWKGKAKTDILRVVGPARFWPSGLLVLVGGNISLLGVSYNLFVVVCN